MFDGSLFRQKLSKKSKLVRMILELIHGTPRKCFGNGSKLKFGPDYRFNRFLPELTPIYQKLTTTHHGQHRLRNSFLTGNLEMNELSLEIDQNANRI